MRRFIPIVFLAIGLMIMIMAIGAATAHKSPRPAESPRPSPHGLIEGEQKPNLPDCRTEDAGPVACVWDRWTRGSNPNPGVTPRYVIIQPEGN